MDKAKASAFYRLQPALEFLSGDLPQTGEVAWYMITERTKPFLFFFMICVKIGKGLEICLHPKFFWP
jgi:hypothetical protein